MAAKDLNTALETLINDTKDGYITHDALMSLFVKTPTAANAKKILTLLKKAKAQLVTSAEIAKLNNIKEAQAREEAALKLQEEQLEDKFDLAKEKELLEWSRSDSPVRMYLREMGLISLLTKEEEIELSINIELGEDIIIDAFCSVPYLIDFILDYKEPLINRERRVKELFKSFDDENSSDSNDDATTDSDEGSGSSDKKDNTREKKVIASFKGLEKAKKEWVKAEASMDTTADKSKEEAMHALLQLAFKKKLLKEALIDLGPTSKLINELVKSMETALKSDSGFDKELKKLEYKLPLFNDTLKENHIKIIEDIMNMTKEDILSVVPEATMVSTYMEIKKLVQTKEASKDSFDLEPDSKRYLSR